MGLLLDIAPLQFVVWRRPTRNLFHTKQFRIVSLNCIRHLLGSQFSSLTVAGLARGFRDTFLAARTRRNSSESSNMPPAAVILPRTTRDGYPPRRQTSSSRATKGLALWCYLRFWQDSIS
jgi:hypothetical protein